MENFSARTKSHHETFSHWPKRRSSQLVKNAISLLTKYVASTGRTIFILRISCTRIRCRPPGVRAPAGWGMAPNSVPSARPLAR